MAQGKPVTEIDFGELVHSEKFTSAILKLNANLDGTKAQLEALAKCDVEKLSVKDQVMLDLYLAYTVNSLYWMFLRTKGINPATHAIKSEINRVRECVGRANRICSRKQPTTRLNKEAAKRFIRSGLWKAGEKPAGGVIKKFDTTNVEEAASCSRNIHDKGAETKQFKASHANRDLVIEKFGSTAVVKASTSSSNVNDKGAEAKQYKAPHVNMDRVIKKFDCINVGEVQLPPAFSKANKKGGGTKQFKAPMNNPEGSYKTFECTDAASSSFVKVNKKGGGNKQFKSPNWKPEGGFQKFDSRNAGVEQVPSSFSQVNKKGGETKQSKFPKGNAGGFKKFDSMDAGASSSYSQVNKKGGETKPVNSQNWRTKTGNRNWKNWKSNHNNPSKNDEKVNSSGTQTKKGNKITYYDVE